MPALNIVLTQKFPKVVINKNHSPMLFISRCCSRCSRGIELIILDACSDSTISVMNRLLYDHQVVD